MKVSGAANSAWLAVGLALTTATQLRLSAAPIGPGEAILLAWLGANAALRVLQGRLNVGRVARASVLLWLVSLPVLLLGWLVAYARDVSRLGAARDFVAFLLVASLVA